MPPFFQNAWHFFFPIFYNKKSPLCEVFWWCPERESNPHEFPHSILSRTRIPIPPSGRASGSIPRKRPWDIYILSVLSIFFKLVFHSFLPSILLTLVIPDPIGNPHLFRSFLPSILHIMVLLHNGWRNRHLYCCYTEGASSSSRSSRAERGYRSWV